MIIKSPIAIFDSGVGSYSIVREIKKLLPNESIVYLADRASFPYGAKSHNELRSIVNKTISWLESTYRPKAIIIASNTPSIQVLEEVRPKHQTQLIGVYPPVKAAAEISFTKHIAILATKGAVISSEIDDFIAGQNLPKSMVVHKLNASDLVALVEPGTFLNSPERTTQIVKETIDPLLFQDPLIDTMTLSSTHLPFLVDFFQALYPNITFLDPAKQIAEEVKTFLAKANNLNVEQENTLTVLTTIDTAKTLSAEGLHKILATLGLNTAVETVTIS